MQLNFFDIIVFAVFFLVVLGFSLFKSRKERDSEDYFLAGRGLSWWLIGVSIVAANLSTEQFVGMAGQGAGDVGLAVSAWQLTGSIGIVFVAFFFLPKFLQCGIYTMPEYLEYRYNPAARAIMAFYTMVIYVTVTITAVLFSGGITLSTIFDINLTASVWIVGGIAALYTTWGGLKAVAWADLFLGSALLIGGILTLVLGLNAVGGWSSFVETNGEKLHMILPSDHPTLPWTAIAFGMWIPILYYCGLNQFIVQRTLAAKSLKQGQLGVIFAAGLWLLVPFAIVIPGIISQQLYGTQLDNPDRAYPMLIRNLIPPGVRGFMFAAIAGAVISSLASMLNSASTVFTMDLFKQHINKSASQRSLVFVGRITTVLFVLIGCLLAPFLEHPRFEGVFNFIQEFQGYISPGILAAFLFGFAVPRRASGGGRHRPAGQRSFVRAAAVAVRRLSLSPAHGGHHRYGIRHHGRHNARPSVERTARHAGEGRIQHADVSRRQSVGRDRHRSRRRVLCLFLVSDFFRKRMGIMKKNICLLFSIFFISALSSQSAELDLSGQWAFELDRNDVGVEKQWFNQEFAHSVRLPGSLQEQGFGDRPAADTEWMSGIGANLLDDPRFKEYIEGDEFQCPFWLTPKRVYTGAAWYQRDVRIPADWTNQRVFLTMERPHWQTTVWLDGKKAGVRDALGVAHEYELTKRINPGETHRLTVRVDNRYVVPVGKNAHSVSDQTQSNWNGIAGAIQLKTRPFVSVEDIQIYPDAAHRKIKAVVQISNAANAEGEGELLVRAESLNIETVRNPAPLSMPVVLNSDTVTVEFEYHMGSACRFWDEYQPNLYELRVELKGDGVSDSKTSTFGMRDLGITDKQFTINGRKIFLRGTLECCIFPLHGYPPTDVDEWKRIIRIAKDYGLNHFRFHSWCPPEAAFAAADELGFYIQAEASCWATFGDGTAVDEWIYEECARMLKAYGNHPSFILMSPSNEPHGKNRDAFLGKLINSLKEKDSRHFYAAGSGWPQIAENQYHVQYDTRLQNWKTLKFDVAPQTWDDYRDYVEKLNVPTVSHEIGQWCVYPDLREDALYTGVLQAKNIAIFRDKLVRSGMGHLAYDFLMASGKFQTLLYKQEIEAALRTPNFAGFQLLDLHDFPGQGTAPVGVLNALWQSKGYVSGSEYRRFCNAVVPLARMKQRTFTSDMRFQASVEVANYGPSDLNGETLEYRIRNEKGVVLFNGEWKPASIPNGGLTRVGGIDIPLVSIQQAAKLTLEIAFESLPYTNSWVLWVYPQKINADVPESVLATQDWKEALKALQAGKTVLLQPNAFSIASDTLGTFRPIFWNRITFPSQTVHTVGTLIDASHPAFADFPTDAYSNWQWQELFDRSKPIVLDELPDNLKPIVRTIDDWNNCHKLSVLFEAKVGDGKLLLCSMDIENDLDERIVARQLRHSLIKYMADERFHPTTVLTEKQFKNLFKEPSLLQKLGAKASADSGEKKFEAALAIDGDPKTFWHTAWTPTPTTYPHYFQLDLMKEISITGLTYLPRQDMANGRIARYELYVSLDGENWGNAVASGKWPNDAIEKTIRFNKPNRARYIRLTALDEVNGNPFAAAAEITATVDE